MELNELKSILAIHPALFPRFVLPDGDYVPVHYHLTEVGHVAKNFIDCGGTIRKTESCVLQLWTNDGDADHRLNAGKFLTILGLGDRVLPSRDLDVEVEYDAQAISQFPITDYVMNGDYIDFSLTSKHTDCLAREKCGVKEDACGCASPAKATAVACC